MNGIKTIRLKCKHCGEKLDGSMIFSSICPNCEEEVLPDDVAPESDSWGLGGGDQGKNAAMLQSKRELALYFFVLFIITCVGACILWYGAQSCWGLIRRVEILEQEVEFLKRER